MGKTIKEGFCDNASEELQAAIDRTGYKFMHSTEQFKSSVDCFGYKFVSVVSDDIDIVMSAVVSLALGVKQEGDEAVTKFDKSEPLIINWRIKPSMGGVNYDYHRLRLTCYTMSNYKANAGREVRIPDSIICKCNPLSPFYKSDNNE